MNLGAWYRKWWNMKNTDASNQLAGKPLRYLIGADDPGQGADDVITEVPYGHPRVKRGISIGYCNLFDEYNIGAYGPYLSDSDTAKEYGEGKIDPSGNGWVKNLNEQFAWRKRQGFEYIELDNPDAYKIDDVIGAIDRAASYGLKVIAKNPGLMEHDDSETYVAHSNVYGIIVEKDAGNPALMDRIRHDSGKPDLPVWFVAFGNGKVWAASYNIIIKESHYRNMGVTFSSVGEYGSSEDILRPRP